MPRAHKAWHLTELKIGFGQLAQPTELQFSNCYYHPNTDDNENIRGGTMSQ